MATPQSLFVETVTPGAAANLSQYRNGGMATIGPLNGSATVAANVVKPYTAVGGVGVDHATDSVIHNAAKEALPALVPVAPSEDPILFAGGFADKAFPAIASLTFGDSSAIDTGSLPASVLPLYDAGPITFDGVAIDTITYTTQVPSAANFPNASADTGSGAPQIIINPTTGVFYTGAATSGVGAGIVFGDGSTTGPKSPDWARIREIVAGKPVDIVYLAGWPLNPQYAGVIKDHLTWGASNRIRAVYQLPDGIGDTSASTEQFDSYTDGDTIGDIFTFLNADNGCAVAYNQGTGGAGRDYGAGFAAQAAALGQSGTARFKEAPSHLPFDRLEEFLPAQVGNLTAPTSGTLHEIGANAIVLTADGKFVWSHYRASTAYDGTGTFASLSNLFSTRGRINRVTDYLQRVVDAWMAGAPESGLFDDTHLFDLKNRIMSAGLTLRSEGTIAASIDRSDVFIPTVAETTSGDRALGILNGSFVDVRIGTEVLRVNLELGVTL